MAVPEEELKRQIAAGQESPVSYRGFDPLIQYLLHRLDAIETKLEAKIDKLDTRVSNVEARLEAKIEEKVNALHHELHSTARWIIGTVIAVASVALALAQLLK
ncbi:MAG: hypothetical protein NUV99_08260 [Clostridia bacterium]|nr:hypothetical protein [Clostridia bacterium]